MGVLAFPVNTGIVRLSDCVLFRANVDDVGTYPEKKGIAYQLCDGYGNPITPIRIDFPIENQLQPLDFTGDVAAILGCTIPNSNSPGVFQDDNFKKDVILKYGEVVQSEEGECNIYSPNNLTQSTQLITIINSYYQFDQDLPMQDPEILTDRPKRYTICRGSRDWITVCGQGSIQMAVSYVGGGGTLWDAPITGATIIGVGDENIDPQGGTGGQISQITYSNGVDTWIVCVEDCCCDCEYKLYAKEPKGSLTLVNDTKCLKGISMQRDGYTICTDAGCENKIGDLISSYGEKYINCKTWLKLSFEIKRQPFKDNARYNMALASGQFYVEVITDAGFRRLVGFIVDQKTIKAFNSDTEDIVISGYISPQYLAH